MILSCHEVSLSFGVNQILKDISFNIEEHEKVALIGNNGAGKSTIFKILTGELAPDSGEVTISKDTSIGYLSQHPYMNSDATVYDELMDSKRDILRISDKLRELETQMKNASEEELPELYSTYDRLSQQFDRENGYAVQSEVTGVLKGLGFDESEFNLSISSLSGGQKTRVALGKILLTRPDLILLDEPTNHLDIHSITWLENFLLNYPGAVLIIAHDRYFLDKIVTKVIEIENHKSTVYHGNYTVFHEKKAQVREAQLKAWFNQQREIRHQEAVIDKLKSFNREKSIKRAESREKMLSKIERIEKPEELNEYMRLTLTPDVESGKDVLHVEGLSKGFGGSMLFDDISFDIHRGERVVLIGDNGTGKTTMLKIINQILKPDKGLIRIGTNVHIGYYDQEQQILDRDKTIFDEISDTWPALDNTRIRSMLAAFMFTGDDVFKYIRDLSGGERVRVCLAKLMLSDANFLILDEPTNHLDIASKEILERAVSSYTGTVFCVSHDRYFINQIATRIFELTDSGLHVYNGNYDDYLADIDKPLISSSTGRSVAAQTKNDKAESAAKADYRLQKEMQAKKRKHDNDLKKTVEEIDWIDKELASLDEEMTHEDVYTNMSRLVEIQKKKEELEARQLELMERWETLEGGGD